MRRAWQRHAPQTRNGSGQTICNTAKMCLRPAAIQE
jgi:hypothetical protein